MKRHYRLAMVITLAGLSAAACANRNNAAGALGYQTPDEFLVLARSPLVVPPEYALRPPSPGEPRPQELNPEATARSALAGQRTLVANASPGERALLLAAKAEQADPRIKQVIDDEQGDLAHKSEGFAKWVMFWRKDQPATQARPSEGFATPLDADAEAKRLAGLTGGKGIVIQRTAPEERRGFKLPGL